MKKQNIIRNPDKIKPNLPKIEDALTALTSPGTVYSYPDRPIDFPDSKQSPVKQLAVNICVTQNKQGAVLQALHSQIKQKNDHT